MEWMPTTAYVLISSRIWHCFTWEKVEARESNPPNPPPHPHPRPTHPPGVHAMAQRHAAHALDLSQIAYSVARECLSRFRPESALFFERAAEVHMHVPEGSTPKDGPSAGVTMVTALLSLATRTRVREDLAMTGELSLTGKVGGVCFVYYITVSLFFC